VILDEAQNTTPEQMKMFGLINGKPNFKIVSLM
jgi:predicted ribonuclease YlaK